jgi:hypothetical protein
VFFRSDRSYRGLFDSKNWTLLIHLYRSVVEVP